MRARSTVPEGAYFVLVNTARLEIPSDFAVPDMIKDRARDWVVAWFVAQTAKVVLIPPTDFYSKEHWDLGKDWIRVCVAVLPPLAPSTPPSPASPRSPTSPPPPSLSLHSLTAAFHRTPR